MGPRDEIMITGGYGEVGGRISVHLASRYPGRVVIAGRDGARAAAMADRVGGRARGIALDVHDPDAVERALAGVVLVANCVDLREPHLLRSACEHGLAYTDVNAATQWRAARALHSQAQRSGARIVIGTGIVPGISSAMARAAADRIGPLAVVSCVTGGEHSLGLITLEHVLRDAGWSVANLRQNVPSDDLVRYATRMQARLVALSAALDLELDMIAEAVAALRAMPEPPSIMVGGRLAEVADLRPLGVDWAGTSLRSAQRFANEVRLRLPATDSLDA